MARRPVTSRSARVRTAQFQVPFRPIHSSGLLWQDLREESGSSVGAAASLGGNRTVLGSIGDPLKTLVFTCKVCNTRSAKTFSSQSYKHGVVFVKCDGCGNNHLIADNLRWFRDSPVNIKDLAAETGERYEELTLTDLMDAPEDVRVKVLEAHYARAQYLANKTVKDATDPVVGAIDDESSQSNGLSK